MPSGDLTVDGLRGHVLDGHGRLGPAAHVRQTSVRMVEVRLLLDQIGMSQGVTSSESDVDARERAPDPTTEGSAVRAESTVRLTSSAIAR
jgi:hypothetical protein